MKNKEESINLRKEWELVNFCEFDKYAAQAYCSIHDVDESLNLGDITKVDETKLSDFNMICGGSPCQDFSVAGKQNGSVWRCNECENSDSTPTEWNPLTIHYTQRDKCPCCGSENIDKSRSSLLVEYLRVIRHNKPNFGIYENVKNIVGKKFKDTFKMFTDELEEYGYSVHWKVLNAKDYGVPQNRERVYLIFIKKELNNGQFKFPEPFDNGIRLKDVLEDEVDEKFYISDDKVQKFLSNLKVNEIKAPTIIADKNVKKYLDDLYNRDSKVTTRMSDTASCLRSTYYKNGSRNMLENMKNGNGYEGIIEKNEVKQVGNIVDTGNWDNPQRGRIYSPDGCSPALNCCCGGGLEPKIVCGLVSHQGEKFEKEIDTANTLLARDYKGFGNQAMNCVCEIDREEDLKYWGDYNADDLQEYHDRILKMNVRIRKLTPLETFRLMGFDDSAYYAAHDAGISNSQLYKQTGNSIVVDVLFYILVELYRAMPYLFDNLKLSSFFSGIGAFEVALDKLYESINTGNFTQPQVG